MLTVLWRRIGLVLGIFLLSFSACPHQIALAAQHHQPSHPCEAHQEAYLDQVMPIACTQGANQSQSILPAQEWSLNPVFEPAQYQPALLAQGQKLQTQGQDIQKFQKPPTKFEQRSAMKRE